jgi:hypothetical protein
VPGVRARRVPDSHAAVAGLRRAKVLALELVEDFVAESFARVLASLGCAVMRRAAR